MQVRAEGDRIEISGSRHEKRPGTPNSDIQFDDIHLENGDLSNALVQSQSISPAELIEYNTCLVDEVCITGSENSDTLVFDEGRRNDLLFIAYQLPIFGGEAVYRARAILQLDVDDTQLSYRMLSQLLSLSNKYKIYPVPNKGAFTILKTVASALPVKIDVYDLHEKLIGTIPWPENTNELKINLHSISPGMYLVQITSVDGSIETLKTTITP